MTFDGPLIGNGLAAAGVLMLREPPLGALWFPLSHELTVLYGRNGAGKTLLLNELASALTGVNTFGVTALVVDLWPEHTGFDGELFICILNELRRALGDNADCGEALREDRQDWDAAEGVWSLFRSEFRERLNAIAELRGVDVPSYDWLGVALVARGSASDPRWELALCGVQRGKELHDGTALPVLLGNIMNLLTGRTCAVGLVNGLPPIACLRADEELDVGVTTLRLLEELAPRDDDGVEEVFDGGDSVGGIQFTHGTAEVADDLEAAATGFFRALTGDVGELSLVIRDPNLWARHCPLVWQGQDQFGRRLPIERLGSGWSRWARLAVSLAIRRIRIHYNLPAILIVDEPERALHPVAQQRVASGFVTTLKDIELNGGYLNGAVVASHSPAFLSVPGARLVHVGRADNQMIRLSAISPTADSISLEAELGITRTDVLALTRWFMYVEGDHDKAVLESVFSDVFKDQHVRVKPMRGASNIRAHVEFEFIFEFTDARVRIVLDRIGGAASELWSQARDAFAAGDHTGARRAIEAIGRKQDREARWLYEAGVSALDLHRLDRIDVVCLDEPDIINYLPVDQFVPGASSWRELAKEWRAARTDHSDFKQWLRQVKEARIDSRRLAALASQLQELRDLPRVVEGLSGH